MVGIYWGLEYTKVLLGYIFIMFIWPSVIFRNYLRGKSITFRFAFCVTVQVVLVNTAVLGLGLFHILYGWLVRVLFYGSFLWFVFRYIRIGEKERRMFKYLITGTYGRKQFLANILEGIGRGIKHSWKNFCKMMYSHWWEYGLLSIILIYGMIYFSYGAFQDYSYGFGDLYPHNAWIYGLTQGKIFSAGVYPEAMHCFIYGLHTLFGIRIYSCLLFLAGIHVVVFLLSAYLLMKEVFRWHYTPMFVLTMFLTIDLMCVDEVYSMSRLQWTLPQEFGLYTQFLCAAFLVRYLRSNHRITRKGRLSKGYWDENLLVFMMALAASLTIHFYPTIMAFFLCVAFIPLVLHKVFSRKRFLPLAAAVMCGFFVAVVPMGGALASGIPFQGSIGWAMNVINGTDEESAPAGNTSTENTNGTSREQGTEGGASGAESGMENDDGSAGLSGTGDGNINGNGAAAGNLSGTGDGSINTNAVKEPLSVRLEKLGKRILHSCQEKIQGIYQYGYITLYKSERAEWIVRGTFLAVFLWLIYRVGSMLLHLFFRQKKIYMDYFDGYFSIALASVIFVGMYCAPMIGLPALIAGSRLCSTAQMLILAALAVPVDLLFTVVRRLICEGIMKAVSAACVAGIYVGTILTGTFHGYLYYELTRYNGAVMTTYSITDTLPKYSYTIVSTTDELYQIIQYGWHEELVNFINHRSDEDYMLPSEYIFIYVEKKPIEYGQSHFFTGPKWLAWEKYTDYYSSFVSQCPEVSSSEISDEKAASPEKYFLDSSKSYTNLDSRTVLESKTYAWCREFEELYPYELKTYYEDDNFVCYYFKQNVQHLYRLGIQ